MLATEQNCNVSRVLINTDLIRICRSGRLHEDEGQNMYCILIFHNFEGFYRL